MTDRTVQPEQGLLAWAATVAGLADTKSMTSRPLSRGGSERSFYRLRWNGGSLLLMHYRHERRENAYYEAIGQFLRGIGVAVPEIYGHDARRGFLLMEDLGDADLWSYRFAPWAVRRGLYEKTLAAIHILHAFPLETFPSSAVPLMEGFDDTLYRWERDYFRENFVQRVCGIQTTPKEEKALENELSALAVRLGSDPPTLIHRDFQSQNIMIRRDEPVLIDFQGMRPGSLFYDLASLLYDPYAAMAEDERTALLFYYYGRTGTSLTWPSFYERFRDASAQRLMQALGAYGFLGRVKGRPDFLCHIPGALRYLEETTAENGRLPLLHALASRCRKTAVGIAGLNPS